MNIETLSAISIQFTPEELFVILEGLGDAQLLGLTRDKFNQLPADHQAVALNVAKRGLIARGLLLVDERGREKIQAMALGVIVPSLSPDQSVIIVRNPSDKPAQVYYFHQARDVHVVYFGTPAATYHFNLLRDQATYDQGMANVLDLGQVYDDSPAPIRLPNHLFDQAQNAARTGGADAARAVLSASTLDQATLTQLVSTLGSPFEFKAITAIDHTTAPEPTITVLTVLHGHNGLWTIDKAPDNQGDLLIQRLSAAAVQDKVQGLVNRQLVAV
ncbi:MAG: hypothetical protein KDI79_30065 [Anaerolineae bacterium]|nr:hypothetical protein [Anaerolineae bacterium]